MYELDKSKESAVISLFNTAPKETSTSASMVTSKKQEGNKTYGDIPNMPTQQAVEGIKFDFNFGLRVYIPKTTKIYTIEFYDLDTDTLLFSAKTTPNQESMVASVKKFYVRFRLRVYEEDGKTMLFEHNMDLKDKTVMVQLPVGTIGDSIAWFSNIERFQNKHKCRIICVMKPHISCLFEKQYPEFKFIDIQDTSKQNTYACYFLGLFFKGDTKNQPYDFRFTGLHKTAANILGVPDYDQPPRVDLTAPRKIQEKYCVIATQASSQAKYWNNPHGWDKVIAFLTDNGYKVVCIDKEKVHGTGLVWNHMPNGVIDDSGDKPLQDRINTIKDADFFIGLPSGLSWLAWLTGVPVVMISGFSEVFTEFYTPYRIINYHTCHGCWNDINVNFDHKDFLWCPHHAGTDRQFECTKLISADYVINTVKKIPSFKPLYKD